MKRDYKVTSNIEAENITRHFIMNFQKSILLSLVEKGELSQEQYEQAMLLLSKKGQNQKESYL